jgi:hypothetical protein
MEPKTVVVARVISTLAIIIAVALLYVILYFILRVFSFHTNLPDLSVHDFEWIVIALLTFNLFKD